MTGSRLISWAIGAGALLGFVYTLSPLTVIFLAAIPPMWSWLVRDLPEHERRWLLALFVTAVILRLAAVAGLFLTADPAIPYANFFGDEEFFNRKSTWLLNVAKGIPISRADFLYAFDQTGKTSYLQVLQYEQALVGLAPYGIHVMNSALYLGAVLLLFKVVRPAFGGIAALFGATILLFLPSLAIWSMSALKEPLYLLVAALNIVFAIRAFRAKVWTERVMFVGLVVAGGYALQTLREGGLALTVAGMVGGSVLAYVLPRPRVLVAACLALPLVIALAFTRPAVQDRAWGLMHDAALKHWGLINTPGLTYKLMPPQFYEDRREVQTMTAADAARYSIRAVWSYVTVPLPWNIESRAALAFLPEQMIWYALVLLIPVGIVAGLKRDVVLTSLLLAHGCALALIVALSGGNIGTLVRHRGLALPYFVWICGLGASYVGHFLQSSIPPSQGVSPGDASLQRPVAHDIR